MKMENILGFLFVFGAAIIVAVIIAGDVFRKKNSEKPWRIILAVVVLSSWQIASSRALAQFGTAFGNSSKMTNFEVGFISIVTAWLLFQLFKFLKNRKTAQN